ncbi:hypothetical protein PMAYCL1PPCAC_30216, partial [Pristionchus mayeri]
PTMFIDILQHLEEIQKRELNLDSLNAGYIAGAPCPVALCDRLVNELGMRNLSVLYGSTEMSPVVTMSRLEHSPSERIKNVGYVMDHVELMVVDDEGQVVPRGTKGELLARGYCNMLGYYNDDERTKKGDDGRQMVPHGRYCVHLGRRRRQHRWPHQGYDNPWRGEHLPH